MIQPALLDACDVAKQYGDLMALEGFSLTLSADHPRIIALAGESGSGKSTAARLILGFAQPSKGEIFYQGQSVTALSGRARRAFRREVQAVLQDPYEAFNPFYSVDHIFNVAISKFHLAAGKAEARHLINEALEFVGLRPPETLGKHPHQLSGGQRQRLMIARAFLIKPRIIVADEPVSMVDASIRSMILDLMLRIKKELGISLLYITHDLSTAYEVSDEIMILHRGRVVEQGETRQVIDHPQHAYTQLLINCIPVPDPDVRWQGRLDLLEEGEAGGLISSRT